MDQVLAVSHPTGLGPLQMQNRKWLRDYIHPTLSAFDLVPSRIHSPPRRRRLCLMRERKAYGSYGHMRPERHDTDPADLHLQRQIRQRLSHQHTGPEYRVGLTDDEVGVELVRDGHDDLLESVDVITISETALWPCDIDGPTAQSCSTCSEGRWVTHVPSPAPLPTISIAPKSLVG
jgi:hypothetical protein